MVIKGSAVLSDIITIERNLHTVNTLYVYWLRANVDGSYVHPTYTLSDSSLPTSEGSSNVWPLLYGKAPTAGVSLRPSC